jgi:hypothetical protein
MANSFASIQNIGSNPAALKCRSLVQAFEIPSRRITANET